MKDILFDLWNGNISPIEDFLANSAIYREKQQLVVKAEKNFFTHADETGKKLFAEFDTCHHELEKVHQQLVFVCGFRLGVKILLASLSDD